MHMLYMIHVVGYTHMLGEKSFNKKNEIKEDITIDTAVAKPFMMLSAYFITAATTSPPKA